MKATNIELDKIFVSKQIIIFILVPLLNSTHIASSSILLLFYYPNLVTILAIIPPTTASIKDDFYSKLAKDLV